MGITFEDEVRALQLLGSLPDTWETFKVTVCNSAPNGVVIWNLVKTKVLNEESRKIADKDSSSSHSEVLVTQSRGEARVEVRVRVKEEVEANQKASMLILCAITAMRMVTSSSIVNNGRRTKRKERRSNFRDK